MRAQLKKIHFNSFFKEINIKNSSFDNLFNFIPLIAEYKAQTTIEDKSKIINNIKCFKYIKNLIVCCQLVLETIWNYISIY